MTDRWLLGPLATCLTLLVPLSVNAQNAPETRCVQGDLQRRVVIFYETGVAVPCEVHYSKDTEAPGQQEVLWRALNQSGYCESQAQAFVEKLEGWGWVCSSALPEEIIDDTEALAPAAEPEAEG